MHYFVNIPGGGGGGGGGGLGTWKCLGGVLSCGLIYYTPSRSKKRASVSFGHMVKLYTPLHLM